MHVASHPFTGLHRRSRRVGMAALILCVMCGSAGAQSAGPQPAYGPFNVHSLAGGLGVIKALHPHEALAEAQTNWRLSLWVNGETANTTALLAGVGGPTDVFPRYLGLREGRPFFNSGPGHELIAAAPLPASGWHSVAVAVGSDGVAFLYVDGADAAHDQLPIGPAAPSLNLAPEVTPSAAFHHFGGRLAQVSLTPNAERTGLSPEALAALRQPGATLDSLVFEEASSPAPVQTRAMAGQITPQDPATLPRSRAPFSAPVAKPEPTGTDGLAADGTTLTLSHGWQLAEASTVSTAPETIASAAFDASRWYRATVPGTVLTTLIDRGVYPDPDFGLNNMAIPERLAHQSFWYRTTVAVPQAMRGRRITLLFSGINYHATVWMNGKRLGEITGAFIRGSFDVSAIARPGQMSVVAVLIDPPPHPGIAHEQSIAAGAGENGGIMALDGPTFAATEGWDWIPGIRDRNMGLWQPVTLRSSGDVTIENPAINTTLPLPDTSRADIAVRVPLGNAGASTVRGELAVSFDDVSVRMPVTVPPGGTEVSLRPSQFPQFTVQNPRLWWPNGYGTPALHTMKLSFRRGGTLSDTRDVRFGIREITYELSLFDSTGHVRRVEVAPAKAALDRRQLVDQLHGALLDTPEGAVASLMPGAENSPAITQLSDTKTEPWLVLRVNGVRIAAKGGNWGMDDMLKRVSRERLEPFFRLHQEANLNLIRNWMGQNTEDTFFDLADEYGLLVWNDFWDSTQNYNLEPDDAGLFLANARDTITRVRNHPSVAVWCGRNEGIPSPAVNEGLAKLITELDGTRFYSASSNHYNLHDSGPYRAQEPESYFTTLGLGFAVEIGLPSPPTLEAFENFLPKEDQWPISDAWAYHDWHQGGNGDTAPFMSTMTEEFGAPNSLADFDRKAQMLAYEAHRAVFEGFNAHLWAPNSGRMLWMTQPAWPSTVWQIFSHDYDTAGAYFGVKKASEPVHVQMNLPDHSVAIVNNTTAARDGLAVALRVTDIGNKELLSLAGTTSAAANATTVVLHPDLTPLLRDHPLVLVSLVLKDSAGKSVSTNVYWLGASKAAMRELNGIAAAQLSASLTPSKDPGRTGERPYVAVLRNTGSTAALAVKLTLIHQADGSRVLPVFPSDNYIALMPGEERQIVIDVPSAAAGDRLALNLRGWNLAPQNVSASE